MASTAQPTKDNEYYRANINIDATIRTGNHLAQRVRKCIKEKRVITQFNMVI